MKLKDFLEKLEEIDLDYYGNHEINFTDSNNVFSVDDVDIIYWDDVIELTGSII